MCSVVLDQVEPNGGRSFISYIPSAFSNEDQQRYIALLNKYPYVGGETSFGSIPREQIWFQRDGYYFSKTWKDQTNPRWISHQYDTNLDELEKLIQSKITDFGITDFDNIKYPTINSCLINKYRSGLDSIRAHRDNQTTFGDNPTVIGVSFGSERELVFKRILYDPLKLNSIKPDRENPHEIRLKLKSGSIFLMGGDIQKYYSHEIPKDPDADDVRYSLTFREFIK